MEKRKLLFLINQQSGSKNENWPEVISKYFRSLPHEIDFLELDPPDCFKQVNKKVEEFTPDCLVAVGGDGTVKLATQSALKYKLPVGILPGGSANGMAKELDIPEDAEKALDIILNGELKQIHLVKINEEICIHLSDIGYNAFIIKKFESYKGRGMFNYVKAGWQVLRSHSSMQLQIKCGGEKIEREAEMIVIANATKYGTGALINPDGRLDDEAFEVIVIRRFSFTEILKMMLTHRPYNPEKTEVLQTTEVKIQSKRKVHFQVDGEYLGQVNTVKAHLMSDCAQFIVPKPNKKAVS